MAEKVGELRQNLDDPAFPGITYRRGASGRPTPVVRGTGIRVQTIATATRHWGMSAAAIGREYALSEAQVQECLAFHAAHRPEIEALIRVEEDLAATRG